MIVGSLFLVLVPFMLVVRILWLPLIKILPCLDHRPGIRTAGPVSDLARPGGSRSASYLQVCAGSGFSQLGGPTARMAKRGGAMSTSGRRPGGWRAGARQPHRTPQAAYADHSQQLFPAAPGAPRRRSRHHRHQRGRVTPSPSRCRALRRAPATRGGWYADSSGNKQAFVFNEVNGTWGTARGNSAHLPVATRHRVCRMADPKRAIRRHHG
jgi:hypothetical protein